MEVCAHATNVLNNEHLTICSSCADIPESNGSRLASLRANKPYHQLVVFGGLGVSQEIQGAILQPV